MFGIGKLFRAIGYWLKGIVNRRAQKLAENPLVFEATFDQSIERQDKRYDELLDIIAKTTRTINENIAKMNERAGEIAALETAKLGAQKKGEQVRDALKKKGLTPEQIKVDPEFVKCMSLFGIVQKQITDKQAEAKDLEADVNRDKATKAKDMIELTGIEAKKRKLESEKNRGVASLHRSKDEEERAKQRAGITTDTSDADLEIARKALRTAESRGQVAQEASGATLDSQLAELTSFGEAATANNDFTALMGLDDAPEAAAVEVPVEAAKLPEA